MTALGQNCKQDTGSWAEAPIGCTMPVRARGAKLRAHKHCTTEEVRRSLASVLSAALLAPLPQQAAPVTLRYSRPQAASADHITSPAQPFPGGAV